MKKYTCPMHPEIIQDHPGTCPKCGGMKLVPVDQTTTWKSYLPLFVVIGIIVLVTAVLTLRDSLTGSYNFMNTISYFMAGFFITFAGFKLLDLKGFAEGYATYDLLAQKIPAYGYIYPFIELFFGLSMLVIPHNILLLWAELILMTFSGIGVAIKLAKKEKFQCACLGTFLKVPLTNITLVEDFGMAALAALMLLIT